MDRQTDRRTDGQMAHMDSASEATALRRYTNQIIIIIIIIIMMDGQTDGQTPHDGTSRSMHSVAQQKSNTT